MDGNGWIICFPQTRAYLFFEIATTDSSVGRAGDCRSDEKSDISRSLVQIRLGGLLLTKIEISKIGIDSSRRVLNDVSNIVKPIALLCRWLAIYFSCVTKYRRHGRSWKRYNCQAEIAQLGERQTEDLKVPGSIPGRGI